MQQDAGAVSARHRKTDAGVEEVDVDVEVEGMNDQDRRGTYHGHVKGQTLPARENNE
jgi:hypothetical protein